MSFYGEAAGAATTPLGIGLMSSVDLGVEFGTYFRVVRATTDVLKVEALAIRHRVYCEELGFEPVRGDGLDRDEYDERSEHVLVASVAASRFVACARLVRSGVAGPGETLPIESTCAATLGARWDNLRRAKRIAELSRLAVTSGFRRRRGEHERELAIGDADFGTPSRPRFPHIPVALALSGLALAQRSDIDAVALLAEPQVASQMSRLGLHLQQIGGPVQHHGTRVPFVLEVADALAHLRAFMKPLYRTIERDLDAPPPAPAR